MVEWNKRWSLPFPCCPVTRQCPWKKNPDRKYIYIHISSLTSINLNITAVKYGSDMEQHASNAFFEIFKCSHKNPRLSKIISWWNNDSLVLVVIELQNVPVMVEHALELSVLFRSVAKVQHVKLPFLKMINNEQKLNQNHKYYTQCQQQMAITRTEKWYFFVYTSHRFYLKEILFGGAITDVIWKACL